MISPFKIYVITGLSGSGKSSLIKELIDKYVNLNDFVENQFTLQDWTIWVIISKYADFYCLPISTSTVGVDNESITRPKDYNAVELRFQKEKECCKYLASQFPNDLVYDDIKYNKYINSVLLNLSFIQMDYLNANKFGKNVGTKSWKVVCTRNRFLFYLFALGKKLRTVI